MRTDSAGASRKFLQHLDTMGVQFSVSYPVPVLKARMVGWINDKKYWEPALAQDGEPRHNAWVIDATKVLGVPPAVRPRACPARDHASRREWLRGCGRPLCGTSS